MKVGFDLDGVLCEIDVALLRLIDNMPSDIRQTAENWYYRERKPELDARLFLNQDDEMIVITSRPKRLEQITKEWIKQYYPNAKLLILDYNPPQDETSAEAIDKWLKGQARLKAETLEKEAVDVYFEDSPDPMMSLLRELCKNCKIIKFGGRL